MALEVAQSVPTDVKPHGNDPQELARAVRNWFHATVGVRDVEYPTMVWYAFQDFAEDFYDQRLLRRLFRRGVE